MSFSTSLMYSLTLAYLALGIMLAAIFQTSLAKQAAEMQEELSLEAGAEVPYKIVLAFYNALTVIGWPFFLAVTIGQK